jgi:hypothetical protein
MVAGLVVVFSVKCVQAGQDFNSKAAIKQLKARHKQQRKALKLNQKSLKGFSKDRPVSKALRLQMKHQAQQERRELREKQRIELQDLKDQQRTIKESQKA